MKNAKYRVLLLCEHPVQYNSFLWQKKAQHPKLDILVAYCSLRGVAPAVNRGFGVEIAWDIPLLEGYPWILIPPANPRKNRGSRPGLLSTTLWRLVRRGKFDAVYVGGYYFREAWTVMLAAKVSGIPVILCTDGHSLESRHANSELTKAVKKKIIGRIFRMAAAVNTSSSGARKYLQSLGVPDERIFLGRSVVDNQWWTERAARVDRAAVRRKWEIPVDAAVVLYCAKLQPWKRPGDLLQAFAHANVPRCYLVFAGDGPLRAVLEQEARHLGVVERVRFLGFVNQTGLPGVYSASDLLVLPSDYEPFGVVVNEAMLCGCPAAVSDRVGAKYDLIQEGETGFVFPVGDIPALANTLRSLLNDSRKLERMGAAARERMKTWTPEMNADAFAQAVEKVVTDRLNRQRRVNVG